MSKKYKKLFIIFLDYVIQPCSTYAVIYIEREMLYILHTDHTQWSVTMNDFETTAACAPTELGV